MREQKKEDMKSKMMVKKMKVLEQSYSEQERNGTEISNQGLLYDT